MSGLAIRLYGRVKFTESCWLWLGAVDRRGYGRIGLGTRQDGTALTHRVSYELSKGTIPDGLMVLHTCDVPACVNPEHLWLGTRADNNADMAAKGRSRNQNSGATHCKSGHEFTDENTYVHEVRGERRCRTCQREKARSRRAKAKAS